MKRKTESSSDMHISEPTRSGHYQAEEIADDDLLVDPYIDKPPSRRTDAELNRLLLVLDNLPTGGEGRRLA